MARLLVLTPAELTRDPRARRQVAAARALGLDVVGVSGQVSGEPPAPLPGVDVIRVGPRRTVDAGLVAGGMGLRHTSRLLREARGIFRLGRLAQRTAQLSRAARRAGAYDVVHANDLDTLPAGFLAARRGAARLVYDAHELYADFEPDPPRVQRFVLQRVERALARRAASVVTVSDALADELQARLRLGARPLVVLNAPDPVPSSGARSGGPLRVVYTGSFGVGRPLGDLLDALAGAPSAFLTLYALHVTPELVRSEATARGVEDRVAVLAPLPPDELLEQLPGHDVGVVFDRPLTRNAELSLPNKLFEYLAAGLAVATPRLPALAPVVDESGAGVTYAPGEPAELGRALEALATNGAELATKREAARRAAERFSSRAQRDVLRRAWLPQ